MGRLIQFSGRDLLWSVGILALVFVFFLPLLTGRESFFFDDIAFYYYPQQRFLSRSLIAGEIAWWDPHTCAGAKPFYANLFQCSLYPPQWIFQALAALSPARDYLWLVKLPLVLHYLLSAGAAFALARAGLGLGALGAVIFSLAYTLSPSMLYMATDPPEVFVQSWLPLYLLCAIRFSNRGSRLWLVLGAVAFALGSAVGDVPFVFNTVFIAAIFLAGLALLRLLRREAGAALRLLGGGVFLFAAGFLLSGVYWSNVIAGLLLLVRDASGSAAGLVGKGQSLSPLYLITLLIPDFFGGVTSLHTWGAAHRIECSLNDVNLAGGTAGFLLVLIGLFGSGVVRPLRSPGWSRRGLSVIFLALFFLSLGVVLGAYTPLYRPLSFLVPLFRMPYPVRFRIIECFAFAGLLGLGADGLASGPQGPRRTLVVGVSAAVLLALALGLLRHYPAEGGRFLPGYRLLESLGEGGWFIRGPFAYALGTLVLLALGTAFLPPALFSRGLIALSLVEIFFFSYPAFYRNGVLNQRVRDISGVRFRSPREHPVYRLLQEWRATPPAEREEFRRACFRSSFDNLSWVDGGLSVLGFDTKPLLPQFEAAIAAVAPGVPYELWPRDWGSRFWPNFSVRRTLVSAGEGGASAMTFYVRERPDALPRFYFQDRWVKAGEEDEKAALLSSDLREKGYIAEGEAAGLPEELFRPASSGSGFAELQSENEIVSREVSRPNHLLFRLKTRRPSLLVLTDAWHPDWTAMVDGRPEKVRRVNFLQRGVYCPPGEYWVRFFFRPACLRRGYAFTVGGVAAILALLLLNSRFFRQTLRRIIIPAVCNILIIIVLFLGAELLYRVYVARRTIFERLPYFQYDKDLGWKPRPGIFSDLGGKVTIDSNCFRKTDRSENGSNQKLILACGDSFTFGYNVSDEKTWPFFLATMLNCRVVNAGVTGYGLDQIVLRLSKIIDDVKPDLVIVSMIWADIGRCGLSKREQFKPYFDLIDDRLVLFNTPVPKPGTLPYNLPWYERSLILQQLKMTWHGDSPGAARVHNRGMELAPQLIAWAGRMSYKNGARIMVLIQPSMEDGWPNQVPWCAEMESAIRTTGVQVLNLTEELFAIIPGKEEKMMKYFRGWGEEHMTPEGNRWVAEKLTNFIKGQDILCNTIRGNSD